jgi:hypothetical protein
VECVTAATFDTNVLGVILSMRYDLFTASEEASFIAGHILNLDGGRTAT